MRFQSRFEKITPEEAGIRSEDLLALLRDYTDGGLSEEVHAFALLRHGRLIAEGAFSPFRIEDRHEIFSGTKMLVGAAVGFAVSEGLLTEKDLIAELLPEHMPPSPSEELLTLDISHLLSMTLGMQGGAVHTRTALEGGSSRIRVILARPFAHRPGEVFSYDNEASYLLAAILARKTGESLAAYLTPRLFAPLGIPTPSLGEDEEGNTYGWMGARLSIEEYAALGELYRADGIYQGKRILPEGFVRRATACRIVTPPSPGADWGEGYAAHLWRGRYDSFRFCGAFGQMCAVFPKQGIVFAVMSGADYFSIPHILEKFYHHILSRLSEEPLAPSSLCLDRFLKDLTLPARYTAPLPTLSLLDGIRFALPETAPYEYATLLPTSDSLVLTLYKNNTPIRIALGLTRPIETVIPKDKTAFPYPTERHDTHLSAHACFENTGEITATLRLLHTPYAITVRFLLDEKKAVFTPMRLL